MAKGARQEGYAASGHQSTVDASTVTVATAEVPDHYCGIAKVVFFTMADDVHVFIFQVSEHAVHRDGANATHDGALLGDLSSDTKRARGAGLAPTIDCTGTTLRVRATGVVGNNLEHFAFIYWAGLGQWLA